MTKSSKSQTYPRTLELSQDQMTQAIDFYLTHGVFKGSLKDNEIITSIVERESETQERYFVIHIYEEKED